VNHKEIVEAARRYFEERGFYVEKEVDLGLCEGVMRRVLKLSFSAGRSEEREELLVRAGKIDLVAVDPRTGERHGIEVKTSEDIRAGSSEIDLQLLKYAHSPCIDYLWLATDSRERGKLRVIREHVASTSEFKHVEEYSFVEYRFAYRCLVGILVVEPGGAVEVLEEAGRLEAGARLRGSPRRGE